MSLETATRVRPTLAVGQLWRSQHQDGSLLEIIELPEGEYYLGEVAMIMPVAVAKVRKIEFDYGATFYLRQLDFGGSRYLRIPEADEQFESAEEARSAHVDGWHHQCRRCGNFGGRVVQAKDRLTLCHIHAAEWKAMIDQHENERKAFYG